MLRHTAILLDTCITETWRLEEMAVLESRRSRPRIPHPRWRVPLLGDILTFDGDAPSQSAVEYAEDLGPIYQFLVHGCPLQVIVTGADLVTDLNDERQLRKQ